jgi:hypothetical protein
VSVSKSYTVKLNGAEEGRTLGGWGYVEAGRITNYIRMLSFLISVLWRVKWLTLICLRSFRHVKIKVHSPTSNPFRRTSQKFQLTCFTHRINASVTCRLMNVYYVLLQKVIYLFVSGFMLDSSNIVLTPAMSILLSMCFQ